MNITLDRQLTLSVFRWFQPAASQRCVPLLMYHSIAEEEEHISPYYRLATAPQRFAEQMQWLKEAGYAGVSLDEALQTLDVLTPKPRQTVGITFDDGYRNFYTSAWPILRQSGFTATMYLPTGFIGSKGKSLLERASLTWPEIRELHYQGIRFGSHTVSHPMLHDVSTRKLETELSASKQSIEDELGYEVTGFAYPYAFPQEDRAFANLLTDHLRQSGYETCVTTMVGRVHAGDDRLLLKRLPVNSCDDRELFLAKLRGCYDWVGCAQGMIRRVKRFVRTGKI
ncbi:MAG TPA: polysaccharide deacetylase family protein [Terriglobia bacterium]|jgi:peptidoglycan/xylan/chitin deacetylase (PgdA/CDA1 family)